MDEQRLGYRATEKDWKKALALATKMPQPPLGVKLTSQGPRKLAGASKGGEAREIQ